MLYRKIIRISTHTLTWSVTKAAGYKHVQLNDFNSHAHVERDGESLSAHDIRTNFNSHAHVERDWLFTAVFPFPCYFNSHAHVERDLQLKYTASRKMISTHTLTWSVTPC